jgi:8-oxo-dGTP diphosphatase
MKRSGSSILFMNDQNQVLLFLRDDKPGLPYRNRWDVLGGHVDPGEKPEETIIREMKEEIGIDLKNFQLFCRKVFDDRIEYTYWKKVNFKLKDITLMEGQMLRWFTRQEAAATNLAYGFNEIVEEFYQSRNCFNTKA